MKNKYIINIIKNLNFIYFKVTNGLSKPPSSHPLENPDSGSPAAVLTTESVHINLENGTKSTSPPSQIKHDNMTNVNQTAVINVNVPKTMDIPTTNPGLRTIELSTGTVREGFGEL